MWQTYIDMRWNNSAKRCFEIIFSKKGIKRIWHDLQSKQFNSRVFDASHKYVKFFSKQNLSKLCFVLYCKNMHWHNCVKDCYIHDMKIHKKRAISIYPTIVLQQIIDLFSQVYNFGTFFSDIVGKSVLF